MKTVTTIAAISTSIATPSAPSIGSTRSSRLKSARGLGAWSSPRAIATSVDRDPLRVHDPAHGEVARLRHPADEFRGLAFRRPLGHEPEVPHAAVLAGLGVAQRARDAVVADGVDAGGECERHEADRLLVVFHVQLLEAVGHLFRRAGGDFLFFAEEDVLEGVLRTRHAVAVEEVDRARDPRAGDFAPVAVCAREDSRDG